MITSLKRYIFVLAALASVALTIIAQPAGSQFDPVVVRQQWLKSAQDQAVKLNDQMRAVYAQAAENWKQAATQARALKLPLPEKPVAPLVLHVVAGTCTTAWPPTAGQEGCPVDVYGPDAVGEPVPDLDPVVVPPSGNVHIGEQLFGSFYRAFPDDTVAAGVVITKDGAHYKKLVNPFGGLYERLD